MTTKKGGQELRELRFACVLLLASYMTLWSELFYIYATLFENLFQIRQGINIFLRQSFDLRTMRPWKRTKMKYEYHKKQTLHRWLVNFISYLLALIFRVQWLFSVPVFRSERVTLCVSAYQSTSILTPNACTLSQRHSNNFRKNFTSRNSVTSKSTRENCGNFTLPPPIFSALETRLRGSTTFS